MEMKLRARAVRDRNSVTEREGERGTRRMGQGGHDQTQREDESDDSSHREGFV